MKIVVDYELCEGLGMCEAMAPEFFEVQDEGQVGLLDEHPSEEHRQDLSAAVDACPMHALSLQD